MISSSQVFDDGGPPATPMQNNNHLGLVRRSSSHRTPVAWQQIKTLAVLCARTDETGELASVLRLAAILVSCLEMLGCLRLSESANGKLMLSV